MSNKKTEPYFMTYYKNISLLSGLYNKESLFFAHMIASCDKDLTVNITKYQKEKIIRAIGSKTKNPSNLARQYVSKIQAAGLIKRIGGGSYKINPKVIGFSNNADYLEMHRHDYAEITIKMRLNEKDEIKTVTGEIKKDDDGVEYIETDKGKKYI